MNVPLAHYDIEIFYGLQAYKSPQRTVIRQTL